MERSWPGHQQPGFLGAFLVRRYALADDTGSFIGVILYDDEEVAAVSAVISALDEVFDRCGLRRQDLEYVPVPEWAGVLSAAKAAKDLLDAADKGLGT